MTRTRRPGAPRWTPWTRAALVFCTLGLLAEVASVVIDLSPGGAWTAGSGVRLLTGIVYAVVVVCLVADANRRGRR